jgi:membrane-associated protease RseP (regulator of RpoE activity)
MPNGARRYNRGSCDKHRGLAHHKESAMRLVCTFTLTLAAAVSSGPAVAQTLVDQLESKLNKAGAAPSATAAEPAAPPYLGVEPNEDPAASGRGVELLTVSKGAPSELGGLKAGDIITAIDGKPCRTVADLDAVLAKSSVGTKLTMTVMRGGKPETKIITLGRRPAETAPANAGTQILAAPTPDPLRAIPARPSAPSAPAPPTPAPPPASPADPAATAPTLRPATDPPPAADPAVIPAPRDPALDLPPPPGGDKPAVDSPFAPPAARTEGDAPAASAAPAGRASLGISVVPLNGETRAQYALNTTARQGAVIVSLRPGSPADSAGLPLMGVIVSIDGALVKNSDDLVAAISAARPGQEVELRYYQGDRLATKTVKLGPGAATAVAPPLARPGLTPVDPTRPAVRRFEDLLNTTLPESPKSPVGSTILDPSRVAEMYADIQALAARVQALEEKLKLLEGKPGAAAP